MSKSYITDEDLNDPNSLDPNYKPSAKGKYLLTDIAMSSAGITALN